MYLQNLQVQVASILQKFNNKEKKEERKESQQERVKATKKEKWIRQTKAFINFKPRITTTMSFCSPTLVSFGSSSDLPTPTKPSKMIGKVACTTHKHPSKEKANGWIRPTGIVAKEDGLRMTGTKKDKRKERQEKEQAKKSSSRIHSSSSKETKEVTKEATKKRKDKKAILEKEKVARTTATTRTTRKEKEKESPGEELTM